MDTTLKTMIWRQFGAAIDMLENALLACPDEVWSGTDSEPEFWYIAFHALFYLDCYLSESEAVFAPPAPFTLDELDERGILPERVYTKQELLAYLVHGRRKCRDTIVSITSEQANQRCGFDWLDITTGELLLYNMRHVQHHAAQLNLLLRQSIGSAPRWVRKTAAELM